jgi:hypothetical protein
MPSVVPARRGASGSAPAPVRGKPLASDDPKMRALEAYVLAQRKGKPLDYGRH